MITAEMLVKAFRADLAARDDGDYMDSISYPPICVLDGKFDLTEIAAALNAALWRPIADAPRDGTPFIGFWMEYPDGDRPQRRGRRIAWFQHGTLYDNFGPETEPFGNYLMFASLPSDPPEEVK